MRINTNTRIWVPDSGRDPAVGIQQRDNALEEHQGVRQLADRRPVRTMSLMHFCDMTGCNCVAIFKENAKVYEIVSRDIIAYACLGNCVALRYENVLGN